MKGESAAEALPLVVSGRLMRVASIRDEDWLEHGLPEDRESFVEALRARSSGIDVFSFADRLDDSSPALENRRFEWDNAAVVPIGKFEDWWEGRLPQEARKNVRRSQRRGVTVKQVAFDDQLVAGIKRIYDETPIRQGRKFWHYQKDLETVKRENSSYLERCEFFGAYFEEELIGFVKVVYVGQVARIMQILSMNAHFDKRPPNALLAKCVERCCEKKVKYFVYGKYVYGNKHNSLVTEFKRRTGFEELRFRRYYVPFTFRGEVGMELQLHRGIQDLLPEDVTELFLKWRARFYAWMGSGANGHSATPVESEG